MELIEKESGQVAAYQTFYAQLATLEKDNSALVFDYESKKGNKEARSHIFALRKTKAALEATRVDAKAEYLRLGRAVDSEAKEIAGRIESMITVHQTEIDKIEQREKDRIAAIQVRIIALGSYEPNLGAETYREVIAHVEATAIDDTWQEFAAEAAKLKDSTLTALRGLLVAREKADAEAAELARLRAETAAREQSDRDAAIAKAAEDRAKAAAEQKAQEAAAAQAKALQDAENKAAADREAAARRELELKLAAEQAERRRVEAEQKAEQDRKDALARAEQQAAAAVLAEQERVAAAERAEAAETAKREANRTHKAKINRAAMDCLMAAGMPEECAKQAVTLIAQGKVEHVSIAY